LHPQGVQIFLQLVYTSKPSTKASFGTKVLLGVHHFAVQNCGVIKLASGVASNTNFYNLVTSFGQFGASFVPYFLLKVL